MTLQRSFSVAPTMLPVGMDGRMEQDISYRVTRIYVGTLEDTTPPQISGKIQLLSSVNTKLAGVGDAYDVLCDDFNPPIGYFALTSTGPVPGEGTPTGEVGEEVGARNF